MKNILGNCIPLHFQRLYKFFLIALFTCFYIFISAQPKTIILKRYTASNGLSDNQVTCMLRDKQGFLWIGTKDGLNRWDGRDFYVFRHDDNNIHSLNGNYITSLAYDNDSMLWIGTASSGISMYDFRTQKFTAPDFNKELLSNRINVIRFDSRNNLLWIGMNNGGLQVFNLLSKKIDHSFDINKYSYYDLLISDSGYYGGAIISSLHNVFKPKIIPRTNKNKHSARTINCIQEGTDNRLWCGAWDNALHEFDYDCKLQKSYIFDGTDSINESAEEIVSIAEDHKKVLWCGTKNSGILFFDLKTKTFLKNISTSIPITTRILNIYRDDFNRMWLATEQGLFVYDPMQNQFSITRLPAPVNSISCKVFDRYTSNQGTEFIVSTEGLFYKRKSDDRYQFKNFIYKNEKLQLTSILNRDGTIFIGTNKTLFTLDTAKLSLETIALSSHPRIKWFYSIYSSRINTMSTLKVGDKKLLSASIYGHYIALLDLDRKNLFYMLSDTSKPGYVDNLSRKIYIDTNNRIWVCGAAKGISEFILPESFNPDIYPSLDTIPHVVYISHNEWKNKDDNNTINDVYDLVDNHDGSFWITTQGSGLVKFFPGNKEQPFVRIKGEFNSLQGIAKGDSSSLWMISSRGLIKYNIQKVSYKLYDAKHGIPESLSGYFFNEDNGALTAGFDGGFISFNPSQILNDRERPRVHITKLWVLDAQADSLLTGELNFNYDSRFLRFYVSSNCFSDNEQVTYMYRLTGIDDRWRNNENNPLITYTNLPYGKFVLEYKAINSDGVMSESGILPITISPPFYRTIYFYVIVISFIAFAAYVFYRYRIRQILKLQEIRNKIARDLHDDIGSTIGSINLYSQVANVKLSSSENADVRNILDKIEFSSREIIDKTGDAVWAVNPHNDSLKNLVLRMEGHAAGVLGTAGIRFQIDCDDRLATMFLEMNERKNIFLIYKEAIHNIVKYAQATAVKISIIKHAGRLQMKITDNGKGLSDNIKAYNGNGINNMRARATDMQGNFNIYSSENKGTTIEITI